MGYSYSHGHRGRLLLDCDACGCNGSVRRVRCPFGYCQATALCPACRKTHKDKISRAYHREQGCERLHLEFVRRQEEERALLAAGRAVRCSALGIGGERVHVLFKSNAGPSGFYMSKATYNALALLEIATPENYAALGPIEPAPADYVRA